MSRLIDPNEPLSDLWFEDPAELYPEPDQALEPSLWQVVTARHRLPCSRVFPSKAQAESCAHWLFRPGAVRVEPCSADDDDELPF